METYQACIWLLNDDSPTFDYTFGSGVNKVLLSDGTIYTESFIDHEWGTNTDTSITDYKYIILYMSSNGYFQTDRRPISMTYNSAFLYEKTSFSYMFNYCFSLQTIPQLDTSSGTSFSSMFYNCCSLQYIDATSPASHNYKFPVSFNGSKLLSKASIINIFNNLPETEQTITITITNDTNAKLTTEEKEIATSKGWTISVSG